MMCGLVTYAVMLRNFRQSERKEAIDRLQKRREALEKSSENS